MKRDPIKEVLESLQIIAWLLVILCILVGRIAALHFGFWKLIGF